MNGFRSIPLSAGARWSFRGYPAAKSRNDPVLPGGGAGQEGIELVSASSLKIDDPPQVNDALLARAPGNRRASPGDIRVWWRPTARLLLAWIVGDVALVVPGVALFASIHAAGNGGASSITVPSRTCRWR